MRRGVTLIEVLISTFILLIGLLGVMALMPVAAHQMATAVTLDRSAALGQSALRDVGIRGWTKRPLWWVRHAASPPTPLVDMNTGLIEITEEPVIVDPLGVSFNAELPTPTYVTTFPHVVAVEHGVSVPRITLRQLMPESDPKTWPPAPGVDDPIWLADPVPMPYKAADRLFRSPDDIVYTIPSEGRFRTKLEPTFEGEFSWFFMVQPRSHYSQSVTYPEDPYPKDFRVNQDAFPKEFTIWTIVCHKRDLLAQDWTSLSASGEPPPAERMVAAETIDGVNFTLNLGTVNSSLAAPDRRGPNWLNVRPNQWIMLSAQRIDPNRDSSAGAGDGRSTWAEWYRVLGVGDATDPTVRQVILEGPDFPESVLVDIDGSGNMTVAATILDGVTRVYKKTYSQPL